MARIGSADLLVRRSGISFVEALSDVIIRDGIDAQVAVLVGSGNRSIYLRRH